MEFKGGGEKKICNLDSQHVMSSKTADLPTQSVKEKYVIMTL